MTLRIFMTCRQRCLRTVRAGTTCAGFTLIELVISLAILGLIATMAAPVAQVMYQRHQEEDLRLALRQVRLAIDQYKAAYDAGRIIKTVDASGYPATLEVLVNGIEDVKSPERKKIYFIRKIPRDPFAPSGMKSLDTWGLRSYKSDAQSPRRGEDVFDVYSLSERTGLNGIPYREW
ncbi:type II secretion system protein [Limnohabitans sp. Jir72]|uniref:type II secretion system protein n=1 Tax=Limnohabitans sp. Jir72 TaxID=1977909 RepID=UPI00268C6818